MKKEKIFFHPIDGAAALTISWSSGPKGDAIEAKQGSGVGFFSENGELLSVVFDEVQSSRDQQALEFDRAVVEISVKNGRVTYSITKRSAAPRSPSRQGRKKAGLKKKSNSLSAVRKKRHLV